jgi:hypothetical protein
MSVPGVRRDKAALSSGCKPHPATATKNGSGRAGTACPFYSPQQTSSDGPAMSVSCHKQTSIEGSRMVLVWMSSTASVSFLPLLGNGAASLPDRAAKRGTLLPPVPLGSVASPRRGMPIPIRLRYLAALRIADGAPNSDVSVIGCRFARRFRIRS